MRMVAFRLNGYRRFEALSTLDLTPRVVAVVGPNEAGKSSLLDALVKLTDPAPEVEFAAAEYSGRIMPDAEEVLLSALFQLEHDDREALKDIPGTDIIRLWYMERRASGQAYIRTIPDIQRDQGRREKIKADLVRLLTKPSRVMHEFLEGHLDEAVADENAEEPVLQTAREVIAASLLDLQGDEETLSPDARRRLKAVSHVLDALPDRAPQYARDLMPEISDLLSEHSTTHPNDLAQNRLYARCPRVRVIRDDDRQLRTSYALAELDILPAPLDNLLRVAGLDWTELKVAALESGNPQLATMLLHANRRLSERLLASWKQSRVSIELKEQNGELHVFPYDADSEAHSRIEDRSDGFKSFLALLTFTSRYTEEDRKLILGIDEAELHLHYDAQADLMRVLTQQSLVPQIIYTTHSAGCLPEDLGSGVRVVEPVAGDRSVVNNRFWSIESAKERSAGFTPLLMAMGANAVAFTPARRAVVAEGPSDALLLPALFRAAMGWGIDHPLGLQVTGGLSWIPPHRLQRLENEAANVVYVTDSDDAGRKYCDALKSAGVSDGHIFALAAPKLRGLSVEDLVDKSTYVYVINLLLRERYHYEGPIQLVVCQATFAVLMGCFSLGLSVLRLRQWMYRRIRRAWVAWSGWSVPASVKYRSARNCASILFSQEA